MPVTMRIITAESGSTMKSHVDFKRAEIDPAIEIVDEKALFRLEALEDKESIDGERPKAIDHGRAGDQIAIAPLPRRLLDFRAQEAVDDRAEQGQEHDPANEICLYRMIHLILVNHLNF